MFADAEVTGWAQALGAIGTFVTVLSGAILLLLKFRADSNRQDNKEAKDGERQNRKDALDEWKEIVARLEKHLELAFTAIKQDHAVMQALYDDSVHCQKDYAELKQGFLTLYGAHQTMHRRAVESKAFDPGPMPALPEFREREPSQDIGFLMKQAAQSAELLRASGRVVTPS